MDKRLAGAWDDLMEAQRELVEAYLSALGRGASEAVLHDLRRRVNHVAGEVEALRRLLGFEPEPGHDLP